MSFKTASAILRGKFLIEPEYAKSQLPLVLDIIKGNHVQETNSEDKAKMQVPKRVLIAGTQSEVYKITPYQSTDRLAQNSIAMVDIIGPILKYGDWCVYGTMEITDLIIRLVNSEKVKGILLNIDSPGGEANGTATLANAIREAGKLKPVLAVVQDGMAASAGMWVASQAQELYVTQKTDSVGSIGAYCTLYDFQDWFEMNGIKVNEVYAPQSTDKNKVYRDAIDGNPADLQDDLKFLVNEFIGAVKTGRGARLKANGDEPFTGKMYYAKEAIALGLIDGVKSLPAVVQRMNQLINLRNK